MDTDISATLGTPSTDAPSFTVVERIAELEGTTPGELSPPLYSAIDPEALDSLFAPTARSSRTEGQLSFTYCGYEVDVRSTGEVSVADPERNR